MSEMWEEITNTKNLVNQERGKLTRSGEKLVIPVD